jgi:hypothetical protein
MSEAFTGTERFRIERRIGSGGMGVVYAAFDNAWRCRVALKTIPRIDPGMLLHLKEEFRALADLSHPNVIQFYELLGDAEQCFFTMELIEGAGFLGYVGRNPAAPQEDIPTSSMVGAAAASPGAEAWACPPPSARFTKMAGCIATSSPATLWWTAAAAPSCSISAWSACSTARKRRTPPERRITWHPSKPPAAS